MVKANIFGLNILHISARILSCIIMIYTGSIMNHVVSGFYYLALPKGFGTGNVIPPLSFAKFGKLSGLGIK